MIFQLHYLPQNILEEEIHSLLHMESQGLVRHLQKLTQPDSCVSYSFGSNSSSDGNITRAQSAYCAVRLSAKDTIQYQPIFHPTSAENRQNQLDCYAVRERPATKICHKSESGTDECLDDSYFISILNKFDKLNSVSTHTSSALSTEDSDLFSSQAVHDDFAQFMEDFERE